MTSNHILLYRLAELMLEHEQYQLSVDLIFDDNQIGDFVKSIQIDSPYQQMLLEGVLTESVKEEKLYVSFTVEGYFHYVLGEVIYNQTEGKGAEVLKQIVEENKLNGAKEGVEQCLIRDVNRDDLLRMIWLIDSGGELLDLCSKPLAHSFLNIKGKINSEIELNQAYKEQIKKVTNVLFADPTDNDIEALTKGIAYLEKSQKNNVVPLIYKQINDLIEPDNLRKSLLYIKSIKHIPKSDRNSKFQNIEAFHIEEESDLASTFFNSLGQQFSFVGNYEKAVEYHEKSLAIRLKVHRDQHPLIGVSYNNLGSVWGKKGEYDKAIEYHEKSLAIRLKVYGDQHSSIGISYNNLGLAWREKGEYEKAIEYYEKSLAIRFKIQGNHHPSIAVIYNNLGSAWRNIGEYDKALQYLEKSLEIEINVYGDRHPTTATVFTNFGNVFRDKKDLLKAKDYYNKAYSIFFELLGENHPHTKLLIQKLNDL
jgi:tetratricopeptide (TPR) repeat protein